MQVSSIDRFKMPTSGPVYQPTTVSYEQQNGAWMRPGAFISHSLGSRIRSPRFLQWILLILMIVCFIVGLSMIIDGSLVYSKTQDSMSESDGGGGSTIIVVGVLLIVIGLIFTGFFIKLMRRRRACPCFPNKEERLARQLDSQGGNGQVCILIIFYTPFSISYDTIDVKSFFDLHNF